MSAVRSIYLLTAILFFTGCATRGEIQLTNSNLASLQKQQKQTRADVRALSAKLDRLYKFVLDVKNKSGKSGADLSADLKSIQTSIAKLEGQQEEFAYHLKDQNDNLEQLKKTLDDRFALGLTTLPKGVEETQDNLYKLAKASFKIAKYEESRAAARRFIEIYPDTAQAPEMQYLAAESYLRQKKYGLAIREFQRVHDTYKDKSAKKWRLKSLQGIVNALLAQKNCKKAMAVLKYLYRLDRKGPDGKAALRQIKSLRGKCK